jgi:hypothetical protein
MYKLLFEYIKNKFKLSISRSEDEIIYLKIVSTTTSMRLQKPITYTIGNYLYSIWTYRCDMNNYSNQKRKNHPGGCQNMFMVHMKNLPFDNG